MIVKLRLARLSDLAALLPLVAAYHAFEGLQTTAARREAAVRQLIANDMLGAVWLIEVDAETAGYIALCVGFSIEFCGFDAFIDEFYLLPEFRGRSVGKQVLASIQGEARLRGINALHLEVARDNQPARRLYAGAGFEARDKYLLMSCLIEPPPSN